MPHQCTKCGKVYPDAAGELLRGCTCGSRFFYYIRQDKFDDLESDMHKVMKELEKSDKDQIERDIRELTGMVDKPDEPVILDLESVKVIEPGKFEIDIVSLFSRNRPLIYKLGEGKYIIDIASSLGTKNIENKHKVSKEFLEDLKDVEDSEKGVKEDKRKDEERGEEKAEEKDEEGNVEKAEESGEERNDERNEEINGENKDNKENKENKKDKKDSSDLNISEDTEKSLEDDGLKELE